MQAIFDSISKANDIFSKNNRYGTTVGLEFSHYTGYGIISKSLVLTLDNFSFKDIETFLDNEIGLHKEIRFSSATDLTNEEWYIKNGSFRLLNTWGKIKKVLKENNFSENGKYVVICGNNVIEVDLYNHYPWNKDSFLEINKESSEKLESLGNVGKAKELTVLFVPKFHMWKECSYETYPDDPGCGIYSTYVKIFDKATGVRYNN